MPLLTKPQAAAELAISVTSFDELVSAGRIEVLRIPITRRKPRKDGKPSKPRPMVRVEPDEIARFKRSSGVRADKSDRRRPEKPAGPRLVKDYV